MRLKMDEEFLASQGNDFVPENLEEDFSDIDFVEDLDD